MEVPQARLWHRSLLPAPYPGRQKQPREGGREDSQLQDLLTPCAFSRGLFLNGQRIWSHLRISRIGLAGASQASREADFNTAGGGASAAQAGDGEGIRTWSSSFSGAAGLRSGDVSHSGRNPALGNCHREPSANTARVRSLQGTAQTTPFVIRTMPSQASVL